MTTELVTPSEIEALKAAAEIAVKAFQQLRNALLAAVEQVMVVVRRFFVRLRRWKFEMALLAMGCPRWLAHWLAQRWPERWLPALMPNPPTYLDP